MSALDRDVLAEALALVDDYDGCFERVREWEALPEWEREAHPGERPHTDYEDCEWWRKRADAALALVQPVEGVVLTAEEASAAADALRYSANGYRIAERPAQEAADLALAKRLQAK